MSFSFLANTTYLVKLPATLLFILYWGQYDKEKGKMFLACWCGFMWFGPIDVE